MNNFLKICGIAAVVLLARYAFVEGVAYSLTNPSTAGKNLRVKATTTPTRIAAQGNNCTVTFVNTNGEVLCTGYGTPIAAAPTLMADGGVTCDTSIDVCNSATLGCVGNWYTRDTVPGAIWYRTKTLSADGGTWVRVELSTGCQGP